MYGPNHGQSGIYAVVKKGGVEVGLSSADMFSEDGPGGVTPNAIICDFEEELMRLAHFECIFPLAKNVGYYEGLFENQRSGNEILWRHVRSNEVAKAIH